MSYLGFKALPDNGHWSTASRADRTCSSQHIKRKGKKYDVSVLAMPQLFLAMSFYNSYFIKKNRECLFIITCQIVMVNI